jgi:hypothetical protein
MNELYQRWEFLASECYKGKKLFFTSDELSRKIDAMKYEALVDISQGDQHILPNLSYSLVKATM